MNKEELIGKLQMVYVGDRNALNELIGYYDGLKEGIEELKQENEKNKHYKTLYQSLKRQKEELRSWLKEGFSYDKGVVDENFIEAIENVLEKLEELEGVSNE